MKTKYFLFIGMIISFLLSACGNTSTNKNREGITHFAYQETENGKWGIMSVEGEVVVQPTFQGMPTPVTDDMFFVPRQDGTYELHNINEPEKIINANYTDVSSFSEGKAFVTKQGEGISCINKQGNILFQLPQDINCIHSFTAGMALVVKGSNHDCRFGYIDERGKMKTSFSYSLASQFINGYAIVMEIGDDDNVYIIDHNLNKMTNINADNEEETIDVILEKFLLWYLGMDEKAIPYVANGGEFGLKNLKGEILLTANSRYKNIASLQNGYCAYQTDEGCGIMDYAGNMLIKEKYSVIAPNINKSKTFIACIDDKWGIVSMDGKQISPFNYDFIIGVPNSSNYLSIKNNTFFLITNIGKIKGQFNKINLEIIPVIESNI